MIVALILGWAALVGLPGAFLARRLAPDLPAAARLGLALVLGSMTVAWGGWTVAATVGLIAPLHLDRRVLAATAVVVVAVVHLATRERPRLALQPWTASDVLAAALAAGVAVAWMARFDSLFFTQQHCMPAAAMLSLDDYLSEWTSEVPPSLAGRNLSLVARYGQSEGAVALLAASLATLEAFGFRWALGVDGAIATLGGYALGRALWQRARWAFPLAVVMAFSPFAVATHHPNPNLTSYSLVVNALALSLGPARPRAALAGAVAALAVAVAHQLVIGALLLPVVLWRGADRRTLWRRYSIAFGVVLVPSVLTHLAMLSGDPPALLESFQKYPTTTHCIAGACFGWNGLLNWPFVDALVRDPYRAHPAVIRFLLEFLERHGLLCAALIVVGLGQRPGGLPRITVPWTVAGLAPLAVQANWVERAKSGTLLPLLPPLYGLAIEGLRRLFDPRQRGPSRRVLVLGAASLALVWLGARDLEFPHDVRTLALHRGAEDEPRPQAAPELVEHVDTDRHATSGFRVWPRLGGVELRGIERTLQRVVADLVVDARAPRFAEFRATPFDRLIQIAGVGGGLFPPALSLKARRAGGDPDRLPERGASAAMVDVWLDLSRPLAGRDDFVQPGALRSRVDLDLGVHPEALATALDVPWRGSDSSLAAVVARQATVAMLASLPKQVVDANRARGTAVVEAPGARGVMLRVPPDRPLVISDLIAWEPSWDMSWMVDLRSPVWRARPVADGFD